MMQLLKKVDIFENGLVSQYQKKLKKELSYFSLQICTILDTQDR